MAGSGVHSYHPILNASSGTGYVTTVGGLNSYVSGSHLALFAVVLMSDIFGIEAQNFRNLADKVAASGYYVVAPDLLNNDPFDHNDVNRPLDVWSQDHPPENVSADVKPVIQDLKRRGFSKIGIAGFCWSGLGAADIAKTKLVKAAVLSHPSFVQGNNFRGIKAPVAIYGGQNDTQTPPSRIIEIERVLRDARPEVAYEVKIFPNVGHGWTLLYDPNDPEAVKAADKAHRMMINWFDKHVSELRNLVM
ncbi:endo-1,3;1,4-beta-D-glucanase isoform X1 [Vigna radiata var. radiata]|uniref:Endo-1,31,4-beta-D-glucanase isoform X1 n=2 Tax=Vigna radiata var. radiata TaxID=3916 RepID=A0A1S3UMM0_VIGRR|nr:endo-1,3;1,4-beta-D-glucanase isoform X1 [Vigna radiata var. radiata]